jgi:tetratricopeptide (TPR) repeat protein
MDESRATECVYHAPGNLKGWRGQEGIKQAVSTRVDTAHNLKPLLASCRFTYRGLLAAITLSLLAACGDDKSVDSQSDPSDATTPQRAFEMRMAGDAEGARDLLVAALAAGIDDAVAHFELSRTHFYLGELAEAAVRLAPENARYLYVAGMTSGYRSIDLHNEGKTDEGDAVLAAALEHLETVLEVDPDRHEARFELVQEYMDTGEESRAQAHRDVLAVRSPGHHAMLSVFAGEEGVMALCEQAVADNPNAPVAHAALAWACVLAGDIERVFAHIDTALGLDPAYSRLLLELAAGLMSEQEGWSVALEAAERYLALEPPPPRPLRAYAKFIIGHIYDLQGDATRRDSLIAEVEALDANVWASTWPPPAFLFTEL